MSNTHCRRMENPTVISLEILSLSPRTVTKHLEQISPSSVSRTGPRPPLSPCVRSVHGSTFFSDKSGEWDTNRDYGAPKQSAICERRLSANRSPTFVFRERPNDGQDWSTNLERR